MPLATWFRSIAATIFRPARKTQVSRRRISVEALEPRYALTAPVIDITGTFQIIEGGNFSFSAAANDIADGGTIQSITFSFDPDFNDADNFVFNNTANAPGTFSAIGPSDWLTLNSNGIVNDGPALYDANEAPFIGLHVKVVDSQNEVSIDNENLRIVTAPPVISNLTVNVVSGTCGVSPVVVDFDATDPGPLDVLRAEILWVSTDFMVVETDLLDPDENGHFHLSKSTLPPGEYTYQISVLDDDDDIVQTEDLFTNFITVTEGTGGGVPGADIVGAPAGSVPGKQIDLVNSLVAACGVTYAWTVTKDGAPYLSDSGEEFSFIPNGPGAYAVSLTASNGNVLEDATDSATIIVVSALMDGNDLLVGSGSSNDSIELTPAAGQVAVEINGVSQPGTFAPTGSVQVYGDAGDSLIVTGDNAVNTFAIEADQIVLNGLALVDHGIDTRTINARGSGDTVTVVAGAATVNGGSGSDTLVNATASDVDWYITSQNAGTLGQVAFTSIERLTGNSANESFHLADGEGVNGGVDGGGGTDTLNYAAFTTAVNVNLQSGSATRTGGITSIEGLIGGAGVDTLTAPNALNVWSLTGADAGGLSGGFTYASFENLRGGTLMDTFQVLAGGSVTGTLTGGGAADVLDYAAYGSAVTVNLATSLSTAIAEFTSIASFVGSAAGDTLIGRNNNSVWVIAAAGAGTVGSTAFAGFEALQGGSANDTFRVAEGVISGISIDGGNATANDRLDYAAYVTAVNVDLAAGTATGFGTVSGIENVAGGSDNDILRGDGGNNMLAGNQGNDIIVGGGGNDTINGNAGRDILIGGIGADVILGNADEDILVAGTTTYDGIDTALNLLLSEWTTANNYAMRVANISNGTGLNGTIVLVGDDGGTQTVFNDADVDTLTGNGGVDWYFANQNGGSGEAIDIVTDKTAAELWNDTDF